MMAEHNVSAPADQPRRKRLLVFGQWPLKRRGPLRGTPPGICHGAKMGGEPAPRQRSLQALHIFRPGFRVYPGRRAGLLVDEQRVSKIEGPHAYSGNTGLTLAS